MCLDALLLGIYTWNIMFFGRIDPFIIMKWSSLLQIKWGSQILPWVGSIVHGSSKGLKLMVPEQMELVDPSETLLLCSSDMTPRVPEVPPFGWLLCLPPKCLILQWSFLSISYSSLPFTLQQNLPAGSIYVLWASGIFGSSLEKGQFHPTQNIFFLHCLLRLMVKAPDWSYISPKLLSTFWMISLKPTPSMLEVKKRAPLPHSLEEERG